MQTIGEDTKDITFEQFCALLNETRSINPSRFSSFLGRRHMSEAVQFFKQLEDEGEIISNEIEEADLGDEPELPVVELKH